MKHAANILTSARILLSFAMLFVSGGTALFFVLYCFGGLTDMLDGYAARKFNAESRLGARLDSIADIVFIAAAMIKLLPTYPIKPWLWAWLALIVSVKLFGYVYSLISSGSISLPHTLLNKAAGGALFLFPLTILLFPFDVCAVTVCIIASAAALNEAFISRKK